MKKLLLLFALNSTVSMTVYADHISVSVESTNQVVSDNHNPHLVAGNLINIKNYNYSNYKFSAITSNSVTVQHYYLPINTKILGECTISCYITQIANKKIKVEIVAVDKKGYNIPSNNESEIIQLMLTEDVNLPIELLKNQLLDFKQVNFESSGYDFNIQKIQKNSYLYKIYISNSQALPVPVIANQNNDNPLLVNFNVKESGNNFIYTIDSSESNFELRYDNKIEKIRIKKD